MIPARLARSRFWLLRWKDVAPHLAVAALVLSPLLPATVLDSRNDDLANHVRFVYEATLALREGQFPPQRTVVLHDGLRLPLFQYYSGSAYLLPGLLGLIFDPYVALRLTLFLASAGAGFGLRGALGRLGVAPPGALLGGLALQCAPFGVVDLLRRGAYPEWLALQLGALLFAALVALAVEERPRPWRFVAASACAAVFVGAHPLQTAALGPVLAVLLVCAWRDARASWLALARVAGACTAGLTLAAYYWLPIVAHWGSQKMPTRRGVLDAAGLGLSDVFWPWPRGAQDLAMQLGAPLALGLLAPLVRPGLLRGRLHAAALGLGLAAALVAGCAEPINRWLPALAHLLRHYQTAFRFLVPATLCAAIALALALARARLGARAQLAAVGLLTLSVWGYLYPAGGMRAYTYDVATLRAPAFRVPNADFYACVGMRFGELGWRDARGELLLDRPLPLPRAGLPFAARLRAPGVEDLRVRVGPRPVGVTREAPGVFVFDVRPERQYFIHFASPSARVPVAELEARPDGDAAWLGLPLAVTPVARATPGWSARVRVARPGPVQLPVAFVPGDRAFVDGREVAHVSADRFLWVVELPAGESEVRVEAPSPSLARVVSGLGLVLAFLWAAWLRGHTAPG